MLTLKVEQSQCKLQQLKANTNLHRGTPISRLPFYKGSPAQQFVVRWGRLSETTMDI